MPCSIDCQMSDWNEWGVCSRLCGPGIHHRYRNVNDCFKFQISHLNHDTGRFRTDRVERHERRQTVWRNGADESVQHAVQQFPVDDGTVEPVQVAGQRQIEGMWRRGNVQISAVSDGFYHRELKGILLGHLYRHVLPHYCRNTRSRNR